MSKKHLFLGMVNVFKRLFLNCRGTCFCRAQFLSLPACCNMFIKTTNINDNNFR